MKPKPNRIFVLLSLFMIVSFLAGLVVIQIQLNCCALAGDYLTASAIVATNRTVGTLIMETSTYATIYPYEPTLYAQRRQEELYLASAAGPTEYAAFYMTERALIATYQGTVVPTPTATLTPTTSPTPYTACVWQWATQDLPEVTRAAQQVLYGVGIEAGSLSASAYGENCLDTAGKVQYFAAMTTDFTLTAQVDDLSDEAAAGKIILIYRRLAQMTGLPAPPGYLDMTFTAQGENRHYRAMFEQIGAAVQQGLTGQTLILEISSR
jgi:hypothetical protein